MSADTPRFFIDHGMIHDRVTGKHVTTDEDTVFCDGINHCLALLNELNEAAAGAATAHSGTHNQSGQSNGE